MEASSFCHFSYSRPLFWDQAAMDHTRFSGRVGEQNPHIVHAQIEYVPDD